MRQCSIVTLLSFVVCLGCDIAGRQQQAEEARRQDTANELREIGQDMHSSQQTDSAVDPTADVATEGDKDSPE
ncbi:MAG: hypothetical protein KDA52_05230 [Planctomycetaceae bacterium]|nr:hypothetical protein [Planctomycetaceae bacterium]